MANQFGIDIGAIQNQRAQNALNQQAQQINALNIQSQQQKLAAQPKINALAGQFGQAQSIADKKKVVAQTWGVSPELAQQMEKSIAAASDQQKAEMKQFTEQAAKIAAGVLNTPDPQFDQVYHDTLMRLSKTHPQAIQDAPGMNEDIATKKRWLQGQVDQALTAQEILKRNEPKERTVIEGADGYKYYQDDGTRVLPGVQKEEKPSFGQPIGVVGPDGKPTYVQVDKNGTVRALEGYAPIPKGMKIESDGQGGFTLTQGDLSGGLTNSNTSKVQESVMADEETLVRLDDLSGKYNPDFFTYGGAGKAAVNDILNKMDPSQRDQFTQDRAGFMSGVKQYFNAYRKWVTGAAASEKEMADIEKAIPSTNDSPQAFEAKMKQVKEMTRKLLVRKKRYLAEGIDMDYKEWAKRVPIDDIPSLQDRGDELSEMGMSDEQVIERLREEGYMEQPK